MSTTPSSEPLEAEEGPLNLRRLPLLSDLADDDLAHLRDMASRTVVPKGERFIEEGAPGDALYIILDGEVEITRREGAREVVLATRTSGEFIGEMSLLERAPRTASARAVRDTEVLVISQAAFQTLLSCSPSAPLTLLQAVTARLRSTESLLMEQQKLASLGTLAAGLAHELNNPAAAIQRSSAVLREALGAWERSVVELRSAAPDLSPATLEDLRERVSRKTTPGAHVGALARSTREDEVEDFLSEIGVERAWEAAPGLVSAGWDRNSLGELVEQHPSIPTLPLLAWIVASTTVYDLVDEVSQSGGAISEIVRAAKTYSHLDQAPVQEVDIHESLESTLVILKHKLKDITVQRQYAADLPRVEAFGSLLNQAWTNLIDNAIDAMGGQGEIRLRTYARGERVVVEIRDDGPGIPAEIQPRLFDPFFTTKAPGEGTGLGLHLVHNTIVQRHHGQIRVTSEPGSTCFQVTLPLVRSNG